jgi:hypothetical protein
VDVNKHNLTVADGDEHFHHHISQFWPSLKEGTCKPRSLFCLVEQSPDIWTLIRNSTPAGSLHPAHHQQLQTAALLSLYSNRTDWFAHLFNNQPQPPQHFRILE